MRPSHLFFDLDGTLTDSRQGILLSMRHALSAVGVSVPSDDALLRFIGPPFHDSLRELLGSSDPDLNARTLAIYRQRYSRVGIFESSVYPGISQG
ncbi:MAG TPA: HAD hydrolase-like protein, partial [Polyangiaceae bacterium]